MNNQGKCFGWAISHLKLGKKVSRQGWNGKGMFLEMFTSNTLGLELFQHLMIKYNIKDIPPFIVMKTAQQTLQFGWLASQADMLSNDWMIVEDDQ